MKLNQIFYSKSLFLFLIIVLNLNCEPEQFSSAPTPSQFAVHCVLISSQPVQKVWISRVMPNQSEVFENADNFKVKINDIQFASPDSFDWYDPYNYYCEPFQITGQTQYTLSATSPEDREIRGEVITPGDFSLKSMDSLNLVWTKSENAMGYIVEMLHYETEETISETVIDSIFCLPGGLPPGWYWTTVTAFEKNYYDYFVMKKNSVGVENAVGVMGALMIKSKYFYLYDSTKIK
jgi:hypothetical protein